MMKDIFIYLILCSIVFSCKAQKRSREREMYHEKITIPIVEEIQTDTTVESMGRERPPKVKPMYAVTEHVNKTLDSIRRFERTRKYIEGFVLQLYSGQNRNQAEKISQKVKEKFSRLNPTMEYVQPKFRVIAGSYYTILEAQKDLILVQEKFPSVMLIPEKIPVQK